MLREFRESQAERNRTAECRRTVESLQMEYEIRSEQSEREEAERAAKEKEQAQRKRAAHIASLKGKESMLWQKVEKLVASKETRQYAEAIDIIRDLRDLSAQNGLESIFALHLQSLCRAHASKQAFLRRLSAAGLRDR